MPKIKSRVEETSKEEELEKRESIAAFLEIFQLALIQSIKASSSPNNLFHYGSMFALNIIFLSTLLSHQNNRKFILAVSSRMQDFQNFCL